MCISSVLFFSDLYRICDCIFNSFEICVEVLGVSSIGENDLLRSVLAAYRGAILVFLTFEKVFDGV